MRKIDSKQNKTIKWLKKLFDDSKFRRDTKFFVCQTRKVITTVLNTNKKLNSLYVNSDFIKNNQDWIKENDHLITHLSDEVYQYLTTLRNDDGVIAVFEIQSYDVDFKALSKDNKHTFLALVDIQNPNNLGAIIRSALAFNIKAIFIIGNSVDLFHHEVIRSSMGYFNKIAVAKYNDFDYFKSVMVKNKIDLIATVVNKKSNKLEELKVKNNACFVFGNEGQGLNKEIITKCDQSTYIDLFNNVESLNISCAVSVISFYMNLWNK